MRGAIIISVISCKILISTGPAFSQTGTAKWQNLTGDDGSTVKVDLNSMSYLTNGAAEGVIYLVEGSSYNPENMRRLWFDCRGKYQDVTGPNIGPAMYFQPHSMANKIGQFFCESRTKIRSEPETIQSKDAPDRYCAGFSPEACDRIVVAVERGAKPSYCRPGFAMTTSGLSREQIRICSVIMNEETRVQTDRSLSETSSKNRSYDLTLSATHDKFPNIVGSTNLPEGTKLLVSIEKPRLPNANERLAAGLPMCEDSCIAASGPKGEVLGVATAVLGNTFSAGPFSWAGKPIQKGTYKVEIFLVSLPGEDFTIRGNFEKQIDRMKKPILSQFVDMSPY